MRRRDVGWLLLVALLVGVMIGRRWHSLPVSEVASVQAQPSEALVQQAAQLSRAFATVARIVLPAVVNINTTTIVRTRPLLDPFEFFFGEPEDFFRPREYRTQSLGSGVIVSPEGYIVTNHHVIAGASEITVTLADRREYRAQVVGSDPDTDLAVLRIQASNLPVARWGNSDALEVGEWVLAIGSPYGLSQTVTSGIVSAKGRSDLGISLYENFIQTDAAINPGNSGGALVNLRGEVVGINTAIFSESGGYQGIGFAIPSNLAQKVVAALIHSGRIVRGWIGLVPRLLSPELATRLGLPKGKGVFVEGVYRGSPADQAGIQPGDIIVRYNGAPVETPGQLQNLVAETPISSQAVMELWRGGTFLRATVTVIPRPVNPRTGRRVGGV